MKYLYYDIRERVGSGLNDRKCVISILLEEARAHNRIAVIPRFKLSKGHNNNIQMYSQILDEYLIFDDLRYKYTLEVPDVKWNTVWDDEIPDEEVYVKRRFIHVWYCKTWNIYENMSYVIRNSLFKPKEYTIQIGNSILNSLRENGNKILGVHLRKGDRMSPEEKNRLSPEYITSLTQKFGCTTYVATNEHNFENKFFKTYKDFPVLSSLTYDNYLLFSIEMYIVEQCDIHIKTFEDSEHLYGSNSEMYYLLPRSMHIHDDKERNNAYTPEYKLYPFSITKS
jgi:hypothetical protein